MNVLSGAAGIVRGRLTELGWTVVHVVAPALTIEGVDMPVLSAMATREGLRALLVVLVGSDDERVDRLAPLGGGSPSVVRRRISESGWAIRAQVVDVGGARVELEDLRHALEGVVADVFERTMALLEGRKWSIDRQRSRETSLDEPSWEVHASRDGELLELNIRVGTSTPPRVDVSDLDFVTLYTEHMTFFATLRSVEHARQLVDAF